jgi:hydroxymethylpyrimidine pyrophosphatase-like HAD family hydrolase
VSPTKDQANWHWHTEPSRGGPIVIFDMDGVLCNADARQHYITPPQNDWKGFFEACGEDDTIDETMRLLEVLDRGVRVVLLTGRPLQVQRTTIEWLEHKDLRWDLLIMRDRGDYAISIDFKQQTVRRLKAEGFDIRLAFEDDQRNRTMFQEEGVPCMYIHSGYYEARDALDAQKAKEKAEANAQSTHNARATTAS